MVEFHFIFYEERNGTMTKIDIISGFLGAGKTTLIKKLIEEALKGQKVVLIENEFGEIGIDGGFLKESGIQINEMNSGCICCSLVGDFNTALKDVLEQYTPDRIIIEPSGVGKLSDVMKAVQKVVDAEANVVLNSHITVADAQRAKMYLKNFGEFYRNQIEFASAVILSRSQNVKEDKLEKAVKLLRSLNDKCPIVTTPWEELSGAQILEVMEGENDFAKELMEAAQVCLNVDIIMNMAKSVMITITIMRSMSIITTMTTKSMSIIMIMTAVYMITIITMQMKYLQAGVRKLLRNLQKKEFVQFLIPYLKRIPMSTVLS